MDTLTNDPAPVRVPRVTGRLIPTPRGTRAINVLRFIATTLGLAVVVLVTWLPSILH